MIRLLQAFAVSILCSASLLLFVGCGAEQDSEDKVLKVGVIVPLTGPARAWGLETLRSAEVVAEYYNERGGLEVDGEKLHIELLVRDDSFDANLSADIAHELVLDDIRYVIGPLGSASVASVSKVLDGSGVLYVHYGFNQASQAEGSLGVLGMAMPQRSLPLLYEHLISERDVEDVMVMTYASGGSIGQKSTAEFIAKKHHLEVVKLSRFDVSEEAFDLELTPELMEQRVSRVVDVSPDLLVLVGCPPSVFVVLVDRLRTGGYEGVIAAQNFQDANTLARLGEIANDVYFLGGLLEDEGRPEYYNFLRERYSNGSESWGVGAESKIYALELILECVRQAGVDKYQDTAYLYATLSNMRFEDPFYEAPREVVVSSFMGSEDQFFRRMQLPICISKIQNGAPVLVVEKSAVGTSMNR